MNTIKKQTKGNLLLRVGVALLLFPATTLASQSSSNIISTVTATGNGATVEISNTTTINGERTTYTYATTTNSNIAHQVEITDGVVIKEATSVVAEESDASDVVTETVVTNQLLTATNIATHTSPHLETQVSIRWLEHIINYLHFYVEQLF
jgi:hypothetical protein